MTLDRQLETIQKEIEDGLAGMPKELDAERRAAYRLGVIKEYDGVVATTSGGETSRILPHLLRVNELSVPIVFVNHGWFTDITPVFVQGMKDDGYDIREYRDGRKRSEITMAYQTNDERFRVAKVEPLNRAFEELGASIWVRGLMGYKAGAEDAVLSRNGVLHYHPLMDWTKEDAAMYLKKYELPKNEGHLDLTQKKGSGSCPIGAYSGRMF